MLIPADAIESLRNALADALNGLRIESIAFGKPAVVEKASRKAETVFQGIAKARPRKEDAYQAVLAFWERMPAEERQYDLMASALADQLREQQGARTLGHRRFNLLLEWYEERAKSGELWRLTWYGLLASYFSFDPTKATAIEISGWENLRALLKSTWPSISRQSGDRFVPDWVRVMRSESQVLTEAAADKYAVDFLDGNTETVQQLAEDLGISEASWFWHSLVLSAIRKCCKLREAEFKSRIPRLLDLLKERPVFRDEGLELILTHYQQCKTTEVHTELRDYVVDRDVWRNPKLKSAGIATSWNRVAEPVWQMVLGWVNEANLKLFFELLAGRSGSDEGRLKFWLRYLDQITWTRLVFGAQTMDMARRNPEIRSLIAQEEGAYATLTANKDADAFMMQIGDYIIVEFSKTGNACNVYKRKGVQFDPHKRYYSGGTDDLKYGYHGGAALRISHFEGWEERAASDLRRLDIYPDAAATSATTRAPRVLESNRSQRSAEASPIHSKFSMHQLRALLTQYPGSRVKDSRGTSGGRLWVEDDRHNSSLEAALKAWGFRWAGKRAAWYYPED